MRIAIASVVSVFTALAVFVRGALNRGAIGTALATEADVLAKQPVEFTASLTRQGIPHAAAVSYQTAPLTEYRSEYQQIAADVFEQVKAILGPKRCKQYKGSYSFFFGNNSVTSAKVVIIEQGRGKMNGGGWLTDGVYVLHRTTPGSAIATIAIAPAHSERFSYERVVDPKAVATRLFEKAGQHGEHP